MHINSPECLALFPILKYMGTCIIIVNVKRAKPQTERAGDQMEENMMTDKQAERLDILARLDELDRMALITTDRETLNKIAERKKALREALDKHLST